MYELSPVAVDVSHNMFLGGVGVELRAKAEVSDEQLKALVLKLGALFDHEEVLWLLPPKLCAAAGLADEQEQSDLRWAGESKRAGLTMGPRPPPSRPPLSLPPPPCFDEGAGCRWYW